MSRRRSNNLWNAVANYLDHEYGYTDGEIDDMIDAYLSGNAGTPRGYYPQDWSVGLARFRHAMVQVERRHREQAPRRDDRSIPRQYDCDLVHNGEAYSHRNEHGGDSSSLAGLDARGRTQHPRAQRSDGREGHDNPDGRGNNLDVYDHQNRDNYQSRDRSSDQSRGRFRDDHRREAEMRLYELAAQQRAEQDRMHQAIAQREAEMYGPTMMYLDFVDLDDYDPESGLNVYGHLR